MRKLSDVIFQQHPLILNETTSVMAACAQMRDTQAGSVLVTGDAGRLVGIFTGRDAVCRVLAEGRDAASTRLDQVMTRNPITLSPDQTAIDALRLMWDGGFRHVPLLKGGKILGVVSRGDFKGLEFTPTRTSATSGSTCVDLCAAAATAPAASQALPMPALTHAAHWNH
jgi:CBS domain-containing protein